MADVRPQADGIATAFQAQLATRQAAYLARTGRYWQGLETHTPTPMGGTNAAPNLGRRPTDQAESWEDEGHSFPNRSFSFAVNVYNGPSGHGYELVVRFLDAGGLWTRVINVGPEAHRVMAWTFFPGAS